MVKTMLKANSCKGGWGVVTIEKQHVSLALERQVHSHVCIYNNFNSTPQLALQLSLCLCVDIFLVVFIGQ